VIWLLILSLAGVGLLAVFCALALGDTWFELRWRQDEEARVTGPMPLYVRRLPDGRGVALDLEPFAQHVVHDLVAKVRQDDDTWDRLAQAHAGDSVDVDRLVSDLTREVSTRLPLYGAKADELAARLRAAAPVVSLAEERAKRGAA
jgi:hypothetical protein